MMINHKWLFWRVALISCLAFGLWACSSGPKIALDSESEAFYETARLIMSKQEKDIFNHLPDKASREEFIRDFWQKRDPNPETEENEFKEEFDRRIEYADARFKEGPRGWNTDRGRIYIYFGAPDRIDSQPFVNDPEIKGALLWVYYRYGFAVQFFDRRGDGAYTFDPYSGVMGDFFDAMERAKFGLPLADAESRTKYMDFNLDFDSQTKEAKVSVPLENLTFQAEEGLLKVDFDFVFDFFLKAGAKKKSFEETRRFEITEKDALETKEAVFAFTFEGLEPGKYYLDVLIVGKPDIGKVRKIFDIEVKQ